MKSMLTALLFLMWTGSGALAFAPPEPEDRTLSPYFFVQSDDPETDRLPLESTAAQVDIAGVIADVRITQVYKNDGLRPIEAIYVFPASTRAAVYGMKMTVGERTIVAEIRRRDEARQQYEQARQAGQSASLLEQQRPNVFQMNVANILPGDRITVELQYTELLVPTDRIYEFVYPTVVGPRYSNQPEGTAAASERWVANPYFHEGRPPSYDFDIQVDIRAGLPIGRITCTSHPVDIGYSGKTEARVTLDPAAANGGNRDFVLRYRLAGNRIESGLLLHAGEKENFFLLMLQPPQRVIAEQIPGREYIFIVDVSGSMNGFPLEISKKLLNDLIGGLKPSDRFNVLLFAGGSNLLSDRSLPATADHIARAQQFITRQRGGGGTELLPALERALALPRAGGVSRSVVIVTDGYVTVEEQAFDLVRDRLGEANLFAFGIGSSVNRHLIEGLARVGMGEPFVITKPEAAPARADAFRRMIQSPALTGIEMEIEGLDAYDVEPPSIGDVFAERPVLVFGKWRGKPQGTITLSGVAGDRAYRETISVASATPAESNAALGYLWARHRIQLLDDYNRLRADDGRIEAVTQLGLTYNLLTRYTSFVAVDSRVRNTNGQPGSVTQPLPLPEGVSDLAVAGEATRTLAAPKPNRSGGFVSDARAKEAQEAVSDRERPETTGQSAIRIERVSVEGAMTEEMVRKALHKQMESLQECRQKSSFVGSLEMTLSVAADGRVTRVALVDPSADALLSCCLRLRMAMLQFPPSGDGGGATVIVVLRFS
jgi:Ca-activated chloride channel family protein